MPPTPHAAANVEDPPANATPPKRAPRAAPVSTVRVAPGTLHRTSNSCTWPVSVTLSRELTRARSRPKSTGTTLSSAMRAARNSPSTSSAGSWLRWSRPRHDSGEVPSVSQRTVRESSVSFPSRRSKASTGVVLPRRTRVQMPRLSGSRRCVAAWSMPGLPTISTKPLSASARRPIGTGRDSSSRSRRSMRTAASQASATARPFTVSRCLTIALSIPPLAWPFG